ncbi:8-oxo-dGTP diphosphatase [Patescibacteria group bacterium]|nr:8-oxo-dGTP diphosphatase [Patescibacteria group bacterium]
MKLFTLCYVRKNGKTLMMHRVKKDNDVHEGKWSGLGGKFEQGESPEECAIREVREESGLIAKDLKIKGFLTFPIFDGENDWYVFLFVIDEFEGELIDSREGNLQWIDDDKLMDLNLWEGDWIFMKWLDQDRFHTGKFVYDEGRLVNWSFNKY